jgi:hypothetical protein
MIGKTSGWSDESVFAKFSAACIGMGTSSMSWAQFKNCSLLSNCSLGTTTTSLFCFFSPEKKKLKICHFSQNQKLHEQIIINTYINKKKKQ